MKKDPNIIRKGDIVKIINPEVFIRCSYPLTVEGAIREHMTQEDSDRIDELLKGVGVVDSIPWFGRYCSKHHRYEKAFNEIVKTLAYAIVGTKGCGGNKRSIYTEHVPIILNKQFKVVNRRTVQTGERVWESDYDESGYGSSWGYLDKQKTHVILTLVPMDCNMFSSDKPKKITLNNLDEVIDYESDAFEIENIHLEKIK